MTGFFFAAFLGASWTLSFEEELVGFSFRVFFGSAAASSSFVAAAFPVFFFETVFGGVTSSSSSIACLRPRRRGERGSALVEAVAVEEGALLERVPTSAGGLLVR